jgi:CRP-like cAMP-binding protein
LLDESVPAMNREDAAKIMSTTGWLSRQPEDFRTEVLKRSVLRHHQAGKVLYDVGDPASGVFGLVEGVLHVQLPNGQVGTIASPGFWVGEAAGFRGERRRVALIARSPVWIYYLPLREFEDLIANPQYCRSFAILTIEHLEDALRVVASIMPSDVVARVSGRLLGLLMTENRGGRKLDVTQSDLASMCGLTRQTVNRVLRRLADEGAIAPHYGKIDVIDPAKLRDLAASGMADWVSEPG